MLIKLTILLLLNNFINTHPNLENKLKQFVYDNKKQIVYLINTKPQNKQFCYDIKNKQIKLLSCSFKIKNKKIVIDLYKSFEETIKENNYNLSGLIDENDFVDYMKQIETNKTDLCKRNKYKLKINPYLFFILLLKKIKISIPENYQKDLWLCYLYQNRYKYSYTHKLKTLSKLYRQINIKKGFKLLEGRIKKDETLSLLKKIYRENYYVDGYVLIRQDGKIIEKKAYGGGLCGVATALYQAIFPLKQFKIIERKPHSIYYLSLYGKQIGLDATIYYPNIDLKIKNNGDDIYCYPRTEKKGKYFYTNISFYSLTPIKFMNINFLGKQKNCYLWQRGNKIIRSCYKQIKF